MWVVNIALVLGALFLTLHFFEIELPTLGKAQYWLDKSEPICVVNFKEQRALLDADSCCFELMKQLRCEEWEGEILAEGKELKVNKRCYTGEGAVDYFVNMKTYNYCRKEGYFSYRFF